MKQGLSKAGACLLAAALSATVAAQTLRWTSQGDPLTMDPHSQNELLTNAINGQVYESLVNRDRQLAIEPVLATGWQQLSATHWRFKLRPNVRFHDGTPFSADDVVFSVQRAAEGASDIKAYALALGTPSKVDALTVDFVQKDVNPVFLQHLTTVPIMSRAWCEKNKATRPLDYKNKEESFASFNANGTGPYVLTLRQPDVKTTFKRNPNWWGKFDGNVQEVVYSPIKSDATRSAALISGEVDFVLDPAPQDVARLRNTPGVKVIDGPENRILFIGMDQGRDELLYAGVKGRNPFKDVRVRRALYQAVDIETIKTKLMRGQALPTGGITPSPLGAYNDAEIEKRLPYDMDGAKKLMAEAGYAQGFEVTLDCPNNRYINDEEICQTLASMWARLNVKVRVNAMPRSTYFPKLQKLDTSMYLLGWGGSITDAETTLTPILHSREGALGSWNYGQVKNPRLDELIVASSKEGDPKKREQLIKAALREHNAQVHHIPLHRQVIPWAARANVEVVHRADNWLGMALGDDQVTLPPPPLVLARRLAPALAGLRWAIGGSTLLHRLGVEAAPADLDIVTVPDDFAALDERLGRLFGPGRRPLHDRYRSAHFKRFDAGGTPLDAMAGIAVQVGAGHVRRWHFDAREIDHRDGLPWMRAAHWRTLYALFGRPQRVAQLAGAPAS